MQAPGSTDTPPSPTTEVQMTPVKMTGRLAVQDEALVSFAIRAIPLTAGTPSLNFEDAIICSLFQASPLSMQPQLESSDQLWRVECEVEAVFHVLNLLEFKLTGVRFLSHLTVPEDRVNQLTASLNTVSTPIIEEFNPSSLGMSKCSQLVATETINSSSSSPLKSAYSTPVPISRTQRSFSNASVTGSILFGVDFETLTHRLGSSYNSNIGLPLQSLSVHINQLDLLVRPLDARLYVFPQLLKQLPSEASTPHSQGTSTPMSDVVTESVQKNSSLGNTTRLGVDGTTSLRKSITQTLGALISPRSPAKPIFMTHSSPSVTTPVNATLNVFDVSSSSGCINSKRKNMIIDRYIRWRQIGIASFNRINSGAVNNESISSKRNSFSRFDDASLNENDSSDHDLSSRELYRLDSCSSSNDKFDTHNNESHNHDSNNTKHNGKPGRSDTVSDELALKYAHCKVKIADLGNACYTYKHFTDDIQTRQYRSPEVILQAKYSTSADMWSLGCLIFELLTGDYLFDPHSGDHWSREEDHLALMFELLGPFPKSVYSNGRMADTYFHTKRGQLKHIKDLKPWPLLDVLREKYHFSAQESEMIVDFLLPMLQV